MDHFVFIFKINILIGLILLLMTLSRVQRKSILRAVLTFDCPFQIQRSQELLSR